MGQQISVEAALEAFRRKHGQLAEANVLLEARMIELEAEIEQLRNGAPQPPMADSGSSDQETTAQR